MTDHPRLLVVDDDAEVRDMLVEYLSGHGFGTTAADDAPAMWEALSEASFDLVLLDRTMPSGDSLRLMPRLRRETAAGVIMVTALAGEADRIRGLENGADDYVTKPFAWGELTARIGAVLRRTRTRVGGPVGRPGAKPPSAEAATPAAVLCADLAGYVRLMREDEAATMRMWWTHRTVIIEPAVATHEGRLVKYTGDGFLAEFPGAAAAVACAVTIQRAVARTHRLLAEERRPRYRIGVHVGPVVHEDGDIYGTTVNLAARLQGKAPAGGIAVTAAVRAEASSLAGIDFVDHGARRFKHFDEAVSTYLVAAPGLVSATGTSKHDLRSSA